MSQGCGTHRQRSVSKDRRYKNERKKKHETLDCAWSKSHCLSV